MAKKGSKGRRDRSRITSGAVYTPPRVDHLIQPLPSLRSVVRSPLYEVEDNRLFHPDRMVWPRSLRRRVVRLVVPKAPRQAARSARRLLRTAQLAFSGPKFVMVCVRRKIRRQVMHAFGRAGRKGAPRRRPRRNSYSSVRC